MYCNTYTIDVAITIVVRRGGKGGEFNIQYPIFNVQCSRFLEGLPVRRGGTSVLPGIDDPKGQNHHG
jgi:hypothetical protein